MLANVIKGKDSGLTKYNKSNPMATMNKIKIDGLALGPSRPVTCTIHEQVYPALIQMGLL